MKAIIIKSAIFCLPLILSSCFSSNPNLVPPSIQSSTKPSVQKIQIAFKAEVKRKDGTPFQVKHNQFFVWPYGHLTMS